MAFTPAYAGFSSDRLVSASSLPQSVPDINVTAADDILDATSNPTAQHFEQMVQASTQAQKDTAIARMDAARQAAAQQAQSAPPVVQVPAATPTAQAFFNPIVAPVTAEQEAPSYLDSNAPIDTVEQALLDKIHHDQQFAKQNRNPHHKTIKTPEELAAEAAEQRKAELAKAQAVTPPPNPVNIELAKNARDLKLDTISGMAKNKIKANQNEGEIRIQH
jgi:glucose/arabinose dehydrogenase